MKFINKIQRFMYGRYKADELHYFLFKIWLILAIINLFFNNLVLKAVNVILLIIMIYRLLSKKIYARSKENQRFLKLKEILSKPFINIKRSIKDKSHLYVKCHKCKKTLRLPLPDKIGIKSTICPNCKKRIILFAWKHQKIEIIKVKNKKT